MRFSDTATVHHRALTVHNLLPAVIRPRLTHDDTIVALGGQGDNWRAQFNALDGVVHFDDLDGDTRTLTLPSGITAEAVAALLFAAATVEEWS